MSAISDALPAADAIRLIAGVVAVLLFACGCSSGTSSQDIRALVKKMRLDKGPTAEYEKARVKLIEEGRKDIEPLIAELKASKDYDEQVALSEVLFAVDERKATEVVKDLFKRGSPLHRQVAVLAISQHGTPDDKTTVINQAWKDAEGQVRATAVVCSDGEPGIHRRLRAALKDANDFVQWSSAAKLAYLGDDAGIDLLVEGTRHTIAQIRMSSINALGDLDVPKSRKALTALSSDKDFGETAKYTLKQMDGRREAQRGKGPLR